MHSQKFSLAKYKLLSNNNLQSLQKHPKRGTLVELTIICYDIREAWLVIGNFNNFLHSSKKLGGLKPNLVPMNQFSHILDLCDLLEMGFKGLQFNWERGIVKEHIDIIVCNLD